MAQLCELEIRAGRRFGDPGTVQKMRVALCRRHDRGGFPVGLAEEAVGGAGDQPACRIAVLHQLQQGAELLRRQGQIFPDGGEGFAPVILMRDGEHDQPGEQRLGLFVPMRFRDLSRRVHDQRLSQ